MQKPPTLAKLSHNFKITLPGIRWEFACGHKSSRGINSRNTSLDERAQFSGTTDWTMTINTHLSNRWTRERRFTEGKGFIVIQHNTGGVQRGKQRRPWGVLIRCKQRDDTAGKCLSLHPIPAMWIVSVLNDKARQSICILPLCCMNVNISGAFFWRKHRSIFHQNSNTCRHPVVLQVSVLQDQQSAGLVLLAAVYSLLGKDPLHVISAQETLGLFPVREVHLRD